MAEREDSVDRCDDCPCAEDAWLYEDAEAVPGRSAVHADRHAGRLAVVTGAASGIGRATALRLSREGAHVLAADVGDGLMTLADELGSASGRLTVHRGDITVERDVEAIFAAAEAVGQVDALANVAGVMDHLVPLHDLDDALWERVLAVNLTGAMRMSRRALRGMVERGRGSIVNVASRAGVLGGTVGVSYAASKHGLIGLTRSVAARYAAAGLRCNAVCPGAVTTNIGSTASPRDGGERDVWAPLIATSLRTAVPDEIAALVSWLASDEASNVNGAIIPVDGGWTAQ